MVIILLADANINGHVERLVQRMQGEPWIGFWKELQLSSVAFADVGLVPTDSDLIVWRRCQEKGLLLITGNRNDAGQDSLENTIRTLTTLTSLHVSRLQVQTAFCMIDNTRLKLFGVCTSIFSISKSFVEPAAFTCRD